MAKAKTKDMRPVPITKENWRDSADILIPIINEVLGVEFSGTYTKVDGIEVAVTAKKKSGAYSWGKMDQYWGGTAIRFYFRDVDYRTVHRTVLVKPGEPLDADKLRVKWAEMLALRADDDAARERKSADAQTEAQKVVTLRHELQLLGIREGVPQPFRGSIYVHADGVNLEACRLTPAQVKAIVDILQVNP
jgi:hypothetical protein